MKIWGLKTLKVKENTLYSYYSGKLGWEIIVKKMMHEAKAQGNHSPITSNHAAGSSLDKLTKSFQRLSLPLILYPPPPR